MKKILLFSLTFLMAFADTKPLPSIATSETETIESRDSQVPSIVANNRKSSQAKEPEYEEVEEYEEEDRNINLNAVQESFFYKDRTPTSNTLNIDYRAGEMPSIRTRATMVTNIVFESEIITSFVLGDGKAFEASILRSTPDSESNIILLKPVDDYIGLDSNLLVYTKSGKIFNFYIFSTDFRSPKYPVTLAVIKSDNYGIPRQKPKPKWKKPATPQKAVAPAPKNTTPTQPKPAPAQPKATPIQPKATPAQPTPAQPKTTPKAGTATAPAQPKTAPVVKKAPTENKVAPAENKTAPYEIKRVENFKKPQSPLEEAKIEAKDKADPTKKDYREVSYKAITKDDGNFIRIGDEVNFLWIDKRKIKGGYIQMPRKKNLKPTAGALAIVAKEIFDDGTFTYFKYDRENTSFTFPAVYQVVDGYDSPANVRVVGDYIIAEKVAPKWTLRLGDEWVCVRKENKKKK